MCELCNLEQRTKWYYEDDYFIVCDCSTCNVPMIVLKRHSLELNQEELIDLMVVISGVRIVEGLDIKLKGKLDQNRRKVPDHWHAHIR